MVIFTQNWVVNDFDLLQKDWDDYDMGRPVMECGITEEDVKEMTQKIYRLHFNSRYVLRKLVSIRSFEDLRFIGRGVRKVLGHLKDFGD